MPIYQMRPLKRRRTRQIARKVILVSLLALMGSILTTQVQAQAANQYQVKAAFILNFARFVEWPGDSYGDGGALVLGIIGDDPFGNSLDQLNGNTVNGRRIVIRRLRFGDNLRACQILFISSSEKNRLGKILESLRGGSVLTIGELPQFNQAGGIIKFVIQDNKVRFEINAAAAGQTRLKISSKLLALSRGGRN